MGGKYEIESSVIWFLKEAGFFPLRIAIIGGSCEFDIKSLNLCSISHAVVGRQIGDL